ncbi:MAG TPA: hypothetical protein VJ697_10055 [Nitrososphaeraceae archaeon]|nr:hypothetical protein [Nitrososphaeraceae archaeon]
MNLITAHSKLAVFGIGLVITFAIGIAIGIETDGMFTVQTAHAVGSDCSGSWYDPNNC